MKFLIDNQLPQRLGLHFRSMGHDCAHVIDLKLDDASDLDVWAHAAREAYVVVSKDEDFVYLANRPGDAGRLLWIRLGNCRNDALIETISRLHDAIVEALNSGQRIIEVR